MGSISDFLERMGVAVRRHSYSGWYMVRCPFHDDTHPSATVNETEDRFRCFVCDISEDLIGLIMLQEGATYAEAKQKAEEDFGEGNTDIRTGLVSGGLLPPRKGHRSRHRSAGQAWRGEFA